MQDCSRKRLIRMPLNTRRTFLQQLLAITTLKPGGRLGMLGLTAATHASAVNGLSTEAKKSVQQELDVASQQIIKAVNTLQKKPAALRLLHPEGSQANLQPVIQWFSELTGVKIQLISADVNNITTYMLLKAAVNEVNYDLALPATFGLADLVESQVILPLDKLHKTYRFPAQVESLYSLGDRYKGNLYGLQTDGDAYLLFLNRKFLDDKQLQQDYQRQFGQPLAVPTSWQELDRQINFIHDPSKNRYGGTLFRTPGYVVWEWWSRFHAQGYYPVDADFNPQIANQAGIEVLADMRQAQASLHPKVASMGLFDNWSAFAEGQSYCCLGWGGTQKYLNRPGSKVRKQLVHTLLPGMRAQSGTNSAYFNWGWNYVINRQTRYPDLAYLFALFATQTAPSTVAVQQSNGFFDPFLAEHYQDETIQSIYGAEFLAMHQQSMQASIPDFYVRKQSEYFNSLSENIQLALIGRLSAREAMELTANEWQITTAQAGREQQKQQWQQIKQSYPDSLRQILR